MPDYLSQACKQRNTVARCRPVVKEGVVDEARLSLPPTAGRVERFAVLPPVDCRPAVSTGHSPSFPLRRRRQCCSCWRGLRTPPVRPSDPASVRRADGCVPPAVDSQFHQRARRDRGNSGRARNPPRHRGHGRAGGRVDGSQGWYTETCQVRPRTSGAVQAATPTIQASVVLPPSRESAGQNITQLVEAIDRAGQVGIPAEAWQGHGSARQANATPVHDRRLREP
jgi:hypothetical protein